MFLSTCEASATSTGDKKVPNTVELSSAITPSVITVVAVAAGTVGAVASNVAALFVASDMSVGWAVLPFDTDAEMLAVFPVVSVVVSIVVVVAADARVVVVLAVLIFPFVLYQKKQFQDRNKSDLRRFKLKSCKNN